MVYKIIAQEMCIGWKEWDEKGRPIISIVEYDSLIDLLKGENFYDDDSDEQDGYDEDKPDTQFDRIISAIKEDGSFMTHDTDYNYWAEPEPCDSYLTYGIKWVITEITDTEKAKIEETKNKKLATMKVKEKKKWETLLSDLPIVDEKDSVLIEFLMENFKCPTKIN